MNGAPPAMPTGPVPTLVAVGEEYRDGKRYVLLSYSHTAGVTVVYLDPEAARQHADNIRLAALGLRPARNGQPER